MLSINKLIIVGHLATDPEISTTKLGRSRVTFPLATHRDTTSDLEKKLVTDYHRVVVWDTLAERCVASLTKGAGVYVEGAILNRAYEKDGERKYITEIRADDVSLISARRKDGVSQISREALSTSGSDTPAPVGAILQSTGSSGS